MRLLQEKFEEAIENIPRQALGNLLTAKLDALGEKLSQNELDQLLTSILNAKSDSITIRNWRLWNRRKINLVFTEEDIKQLEQSISGLFERLPQIIQDISTELAPKILTSLKIDWKNQRRYNKKAIFGFEQRLFKQWGSALDKLGILLEIAREYGGSQNDKLNENNTSTPHKNEVLIRLHARGVQVTTEILVLLTKGLADGAIARWRTLHEIATIATFISDNDDDLAERYILHEAMESKRAAKEYLDYQEYLKCESVDPHEMEEIDSACIKLIARYGNSYRSTYGWASKHLSLKDPKFVDIQCAVGMDYQRLNYRLASHNVHANPKGLFFKLGVLDEADLLLTGPSNIGLADPGYRTAISLLQISSSLSTLNPNLDSIVALNIMRLLTEEINTAFGDAHEQLEQDSSLIAES